MALVALAGCAAGAPHGGVAIAPPDGIAAGPIDWQPMQRVLAEHVSAGGRVDYFAVAHAGPMRELGRAYAHIARVGPTSQPGLFATRADKLAYYINAHNLFALLAIAPAFGPGTIDPKRVSDLPAPLDTGYTFTLDGRAETLASVRQHVADLLDGDPRPMLALCSGRRSDPPLRRDVYSADQLETQLADQLVRVLRDCEINHAARRVELPAGIADFREYYWGRYLAQPGRSREGIGFVTVLLTFADERGRAWLNRGLSYRVARAPKRPAEQFNNQPLFLGED